MGCHVPLPSPKNSYVDVLTPTSSEGDLLWKGLYRGNQVTMKLLG